MLIWRWVKSVIAGWRFNITASKQEIALNAVPALAKDNQDEVLRLIKLVFEHGNKALELESQYISDDARQDVLNRNMRAREQFYRVVPNEDLQVISQIRGWLMLEEHKDKPNMIAQLLDQVTLAKSNLGVDRKDLALLYGNNRGNTCPRPVQVVMLQLVADKDQRKAEARLDRIAYLATNWLPVLFYNEGIAA